MSIKVKIVLWDSETKEGRTFIQEYTNFAEAKLLWTEGVYSCDCHRSRFLWPNTTRPGPVHYRGFISNRTANRIELLKLEPLDKYNMAEALAEVNR